MQDDYNNMPAAKAGGFIADHSCKQVSTYRVAPNQSIRSGLFVEWYGTEDDEVSKTSQAIKPLGCAALDKLDVVDGEKVTYEEGDSFPVLSRGQIWAIADGDIAIDDPVFLRYRFFTQQVQIVFDVNFVTGNTINGTFGGITIAAVPFNTSHTQTLTNLADAIRDTGLSRLVGVNPGTRTLTVTIDPDLDPALGSPIGTYVAGTNFTVTGGASQAVDTVTEARAPSTGDTNGALRADADNTGAGVTAIEVTQARFLTEASRGDLVLVELNLP